MAVSRGPSLLNVAFKTNPALADSAERRDLHLPVRDVRILAHPIQRIKAVLGFRRSVYEDGQDGPVTLLFGVFDVPGQ